MSGLTRSDLYVRSLKVHNQSSNILEMDLLGNLNVNTKNFSGNIKENVDLKAASNLSLSTTDGNIETKSTNGNIIVRNGTYTDINSLNYTYTDGDVDETSYTYFDNDQIVKPYTTKESVVALRDESLLIESLNSDKKLTLYSNNGINNVAHGNITSITDNNYIVQANNKINFTSLGFITLNSERIIGTTEEDISLFSSTGNIILGGNGITNSGININSITNNNFVGIGKSSNATRNIDINVENVSTDNSRKNGLVISNSSNAKNSDQESINPEIELSNANTKLDIGIGAESDDLNLKIVAKKVNIGTTTYFVPLNNFKFVSEDVGRIIKWNDTTYGTDTILEVIKDDTHGVIARISFYNSDQVTAFGYQIGYIDRSNFSYLRTKTSSGLHLGTNNSNIINITDQGNIGINTEVPDATLKVENTFGDMFNNNLDTSKTYFNSKSIQLQNGNLLVVSNSSYTGTISDYYETGATESSTLYNLEGFIYNDQNTLIYNFSIYEESFIEIVFGLDNLPGDNDLFVVSYTYGSYNNTFRGKKTETNTYTNQGAVYSNNNLKTTYTHNEITTSTWAQYSGFLWKDNNSDAAIMNHEFNNVKSFSFPELNISGYILLFSDSVYEISGGPRYYQKIYAQIYKTSTIGGQISNSTSTNSYFEISNGLNEYTGTNLFNSNLDNSKIWNLNTYFNDIEVNTQNNSFLITSNFRLGYYSGSESNWGEESSANYSSTINVGYNFSILHCFQLTESSASFILTRKNFGSNLFSSIKDTDDHSGEAASTYAAYKVTGVRIKLAKTDTSGSIPTKDYLLTYYKKNINNTRNDVYIKRITVRKTDFQLSLDGNPTKLDSTTFTDSSTNTLLEDVPGIDFKEEGKLIIAWINGTNLKYVEKDISVSTTSITFINSNTPNNYDKAFVVCLSDLLGNYKETVVMWNNSDTSNIFNQNSITLKKILSTFNIFSVSNTDLNFSITNSGELNYTSNNKINFNNSLEIDSTSETVTMKKNLILSGLESTPTSSTPGVEGQINYNGSNIYIYLGSAWKKFTLTTI